MHGRVDMEDSVSFLAEWYDQVSDLHRRFQLFFHPCDNSVEMYDVKNQRPFLRRTKYENLRLDDLFVGNTVLVLTRQLHLIDYGDQFTANKLGRKNERTLALIKPDSVTRIGDVLETIYASNLIVTKAKMVKLNRSQAADFYVEHQSKPFFNILVEFLSSGAVVALEVRGEKALSVWSTLLGPTDPALARRDDPRCMRACYGTDLVRNVGHGSDSCTAAARELEFFFPSTVDHGPRNTALYTDTTCCIIKPHAMSEGLAGKIIKSITSAGFEISALEMFIVDRESAEKFLEVYKSVVPEYRNMVSELYSGPFMVLEIHCTDAPTVFRQFCGPPDPEMARHLRPTTLRALYGKTKVQNAVHCTDLPDDAGLELQYFFKTLG